MINRILHSWPFHMKVMKFAEGSFNKFGINDHSCKILYIPESDTEVGHRRIVSHSLESFTINFLNIHISATTSENPSIFEHAHIIE